MANSRLLMRDVILALSDTVTKAHDLLRQLGIDWDASDVLDNVRQLDLDKTERTFRPYAR